MPRFATRMIVGAISALAVVAGGTAAAMRRSEDGTLAGKVVFTTHGAHGVVLVFNAANRVVARHDESYPRGHFRFALEPGHYAVKLRIQKRWGFFYCPHQKTARVHARRTTRVTLSQGCEGTY